MSKYLNALLANSCLFVSKRNTTKGAKTRLVASIRQLCHNGLMPGKSRAQQKAEALAMREGRASKSAYHPGFDRRATDYCMLGATNEELAQLFGVSVSANQKWLVARPSFARAVRKGREEADARVARSMFRAATGLKLKEVRTRLGENGQVLEKTETIKEQAPNVNAGTLWLTNRRSDRWRDRQGGGCWRLVRPGGAGERGDGAGRWQQSQGDRG